MKILHLKIEGFRSLKNVEWKPGDLNILIGPNASGKSNLLRLLRMLSVSARGGLADYVQREGGMGALVWDGQVEYIQADLHTTFPNSLPEEWSKSRSDLHYLLSLQKTNYADTLRVSREYIRFIEDTGFVKEKIPGERLKIEAFLHHVNLPGVFVWREADSESHLIDKRDLDADRTFLSTAASPHFTLNALTPTFRKDLADWRIYAHFDTGPNAPVRGSIVTRHETVVAPDGQNLVTVLHTLYASNRQFKEEINRAMRVAFGEDFDEVVFPPAADQRIQMRLRWKSLKTERSAADLSDGTLRFLYLLTVLGTPEPPSLIAIDEPEIGLHPSMFPIIAEFAAQASERTQVLLATHSSDLLDAFREAKATTTVFETEAGETRLRNLSGESLAHWLKDYTMGELFRSGELEDME